MEESVVYCGKCLNEFDFSSMYDPLPHSTDLTNRTKLPRRIK